MFLKIALISLWSHCDSGYGALRSLSGMVDIFLGQSQSQAQQNGYKILLTYYVSKKQNSGF